MKTASVLVFDMDGVLAEVSESYLAAIAATVERLTGRKITREVIDEYKHAGGWNNDWALAHELVKQTASAEIGYEEVVAVFQDLFIGTNGDGLLAREKWIPQAGLLERLAGQHRLAIFTGRPRNEIEITLRRFAPSVSWASIVADEDVARPKPAPDGLRLIAAANEESEITYVGDNVDDARSARGAGVRFIGIAGAGEVRLAERLRAEGAMVVIPSVNEIEGVL